MNLLNCADYMEHCLKIRDKKGNIVPLKMNRPQLRLYNQIKELREQGIPVRILILKARQMGFSTVVEAILFWSAATARNVQNLAVAHQEEATRNMLAMTKRYYEQLPEPVKPMRKASNANEVMFGAPPGADTKGLDSSVRIATAGGKGIGRSYTLKNAHLSEFAFWPGDKNDTLTGIMQAVPDEPDTMVFIESTANGFDQFKTMWDEAADAWSRGERDGWCPFFAAWHEMTEYRRNVPDGFERTAEEQELADAFKLDDEQLAWRRWCIKTNCGGDINLFKQEYPSTPEEAFIASGTCIFDSEAIVRWLENTRDTVSVRGRFRYVYDGVSIRDSEWIDDALGDISIYERPVPGVPYVIGGDTAGESGDAWSDYFVGQCINNMTGRQAAVLHGRMDEDEYARQMYCLGEYYNRALLGVEVNFSTHPTKELDRLGYKNLYVREQTDTYTGKVKKTYGFKTDRITRPDIIAGLQELARDNLELITDRDTLNEMLSFARNDKGRAEALPGSHDDCVMALAIAYAIRNQQSTTVRKESHAQQEKLISKLNRRRR